GMAATCQGNQQTPRTAAEVDEPPRWWTMARDEGLVDGKKRRAGQTGIVTSGHARIVEAVPQAAIDALWKLPVSGAVMSLDRGGPHKNCRVRLSASALRELEAFASSLATGFLAFLHPAIAREITGVAEALGHVNDSFVAIDAFRLGLKAKHCLQCS